MDTAITLLLGVLSAAGQIVPALLNTAQTAGPALSNTQPVTTSEAAQIVADVEVAAITVPALLPVVPLISKAFDGGTFTDTDLATLQTAADAIDAQVAAAAATEETTAAT